MAMKKRIILVGKGGSGKDFAREALQGVGLVYAVSHTSRAPRKNETEGKDYFFLTDEDFQKLEKEDYWYEAIQFNGWWYGTSKLQFANDQLFIMTPSGLEHLSPTDRSESIVIYFDIDEDTRRERLSTRGDADKIERRLQTDREDFEGYVDHDIKVVDPKYKIDDVIKYITFISQDFLERYTNKIPNEQKG